MIAGLSFGLNSPFGLFLEPVSDALGFGREVLSLALAVGMLLNGFCSILWGMANDRLGATRCCTLGALLSFGSLYGASRNHYYSSTCCPLALLLGAGADVGLPVWVGATASSAWGT